MARMGARVSVTELSEIKELITALANNYDNLPIDVKRAFSALGNGDLPSWDREWLSDNGFDPNSVKIVADGAVVDRAISLHPAKKMLLAYDENMEVIEIKADNAMIINDDGRVIEQW